MWEKAKLVGAGALLVVFLLGAYDYLNFKGAMIRWTRAVENELILLKGSSGGSFSSSGEQRSGSKTEVTK